MTTAEARMLRKLGKKIRRVRGYSSLTLPALAKKSGVTKSNLSKIENGIGNPTLLTISRIAHAFWITPGELIS